MSEVTTYTHYSLVFRQGYWHVVLSKPHLSDDELIVYRSHSYHQACAYINRELIDYGLHSYDQACAYDRAYNPANDEFERYW